MATEETTERTERFVLAPRRDEYLIRRDTFDAEMEMWVEREVFGPFPTRLRARQFMIDRGGSR